MCRRRVHRMRCRFIQPVRVKSGFEMQSCFCKHLCDIYRCVGESELRFGWSAKFFETRSKSSVRIYLTIFKRRWPVI